MTRPTIVRSVDDLSEFSRTIEIAQLLGVSDGSVRALIRRGELRATWIGRLCRVQKTAVIEWLATRADRKPDRPIGTAIEITE